MQKVVPFLWFDDQAEEAMQLYTSVFKNARILNVSRFGDDVPGPKGKVLTGTIEIDGTQIMVLNGGPEFHFTEAISLYVHCETQEEVDHLWEKLSEGGEKSMCGWLKDKFGVSWQIVPTVLEKLMSDPDPVKAHRVTQAMLKMQKLDIRKLQEAYEGK